ncbi:hypothetical protein COBT_001912 [Conglomerata obtusa]
MELDIANITNKILSNECNVASKTRLLFYLKNSTHPASPFLITIYFKLTSVLLKHEAAYVLGQKQAEESIPVLMHLLRDETEDEIVRHEAGEALGNYLREDCVAVLREFVDDRNVPVKETCYLGIKKYDEFVERLKCNSSTIHDQFTSNTNYDDHTSNTNHDIIRNTNYASINNNKAGYSSNTNYADANYETYELNTKLYHNELKETINRKYKLISDFDSHDPAYPIEVRDIEILKTIFLNVNECLYSRYKAMFSLRDLKSKEAIDILGQGFKDSSALFKHEIAFVFGQLRMKESVEYMKNTLDDLKEHGMVRHECAEALGAIGTKEAYEALQKHIKDPIDVVRESVEVAFDIYNYENNNETEYAILTI